MTTPINEAAERLRAALHHVGPPLEADLDAALATERRNTVEQIRVRLVDNGASYEWGDIESVLDETEVAP